MFLAVVLTLVGRAEVPFPSCASQNCPDPKDYASYLFLPAGLFPDDFDVEQSGAWKYLQNTGLNVLDAWRLSTGRPDVVIAVLDSGIDWSQEDLLRKVRLNTAELPLPADCSTDFDCNRDGVVNIDDFSQTPDWNRNQRLDPQDLILAFSDGRDDDGNGYTDDIAGWDFLEWDNDPEDNTRFFHGTNRALDALAEANNASGMPGIAPNVMFWPLRVSDTFVSREAPFARAVVYAADSGVSLISEALGAMSASPAGQKAIDYAYRRGIPIIASAADEQSFHHNYPGAFLHTIWVNSIRNGDGLLILDTEEYDLLNGCTNFGGQAWISVSSTGCSSEATSRTAGLAALLLSHAANQFDRGLLNPHPFAGRPLSAGEVKQLLRSAADDIDHSDDLGLTMAGEFSLLGVPFFGPFFESMRFPTGPGWDQYTGFGRPDAVKLLEQLSNIPPETDLIGLNWFELVRPGEEIPLWGQTSSRVDQQLDYQLEAGCGVEPEFFSVLAAGTLPSSDTASALDSWDPGLTAEDCGFDPEGPLLEPDDHSITLRLTVTDSQGNSGEDRRVVAIFEDPGWAFPPKRLSGSSESGATLADLNRDGILDIIAATGAGAVHAYSGSGGKSLAGFPVWTRPQWTPKQPELATVREEIVAPSAVGDLNGDGNVEIVVASLQGLVYAFDDHGRTLPGFPVRTASRFSARATRDSFNDPQPGILGAPTLSDLDGDGNLEILVSAMDGQLYAWWNNGQSIAGFPVSLADPERVETNSEGQLSPLDETARSQLRKSVGSPAVGDLDGDGKPEILVGTAERYQDDTPSFSTDGSLVLGVLQDQLEGEESPAEISFQLTSRLYAVAWDRIGSETPFSPGWPAAIPVLLAGGLPTVATGVVGSPALAPDGMGGLQVGTFSAVGPALLLNSRGESVLGVDDEGLIRPLGLDFPGTGFPFVPGSAGSADAPFFGALGSGIFVDLDRDGTEEFVAPTSGVRQLLDIAAPGSQEFSDHQLSAWNTVSGQLRSGFPVVMEDLQFLQGPSAADVDGDGYPEILIGSGGYFVHAIRRDGSEAVGWPKFTNGWIVGSPVAGDVDGDGLLEVIATTREGYLFTWNTPAPATAESVPWQGFGHDSWNSQNTTLPTFPTAPPRYAFEAILWQLEAFWQRLRGLW